MLLHPSSKVCWLTSISRQLLLGDSIRTGIGSIDPDVNCLPLWNHFPKSRTMCMKMELLMPATLSGNSYLVCREIKVCQRVGASLLVAPVNFHRIPVVDVKSDNLGGTPSHGGREDGCRPRVRHPEPTVGRDLEGSHILGSVKSINFEQIV